MPLSSFATVDRSVGPTSVNHVGQLQAVTISFGLAPGTALGTATARIEPGSTITSPGRRAVAGVPSSRAMAR